MTELDGQPYTVVVVGQGSAVVASDTAVLHLGLEAWADGAGDALSTVSQRSEAVVSAIRSHGIADADIQTQGLSLWPRMDNQGGRVVAYVASYSLMVRLRNLSAVSEVIDAISGAAGDALRLGGFRASASDAATARADAAARAVEDARRRAQRLAEAGGVRLGRVIAMVEGPATPLGLGHRLLRSGGPVVASGMPIEAGSAEVNASVTVTFEIEE